MLSAIYADILRQEGFQLIGRLDYRLHLTIWWNPEKLLQVVILSIGRSTLIKGDKSYYLKSVSPEGETWARDIGLLHDYLEGATGGYAGSGAGICVDKSSGEGRIAAIPF